MGLVITLILIGILLILAEIFLIPGIGIAGFLGVASICGSTYYAFDYLGSGPGAIVTVVNILLLTVLICYALRAKTWKRLELKTVLENNASEMKVNVGDRGKAVTRLGPVGSARFDNVSYEVTALEGMIDAGSEIEVALMENNKIYVKPVAEDEAF